jgi:predicted cytidylate kinase
MRIAISGPPGSGKTTICMLVAKRLDCDCVLVGQIFRQLAIERGVPLETFQRLAEEDETIDRELDARMLATATSKEEIIIEGRMAGPMLKAKHVPVFAVYVDADERVRAERIAKRENKDVEAVLREMRARMRSERKRYLAYYGTDPSRRELYDLWIDSSKLTAEAAADMVVESARRARADDAHKVEKG